MDPRLHKAEYLDLFAILVIHSVDISFDRKFFVAMWTGCYELRLPVTVVLSLVHHNQVLWAIVVLDPVLVVNNFRLPQWVA